MTVAMEMEMPAPGEWTTDDLDELPEDGRRRELIDGVLFESPSPTSFHQTLGMLLGSALHAICPHDYVVTLGVDIRIGPRRSLSPDVLVVNRSAALRRPSYFRPADVLLAVEIVSPGSVTMDRITKVYVGTGTYDDVLRLEEPFPVSIPIASLISPSED